MDESANQNNNQQPCFRKVIGNTTYVVCVHFSETSKETMEDIKSIYSILAYGFR